MAINPNPFHQIDEELFSRLELVNTQVFPLPGGTGRRLGEPDPRLSKLQGTLSDEITYYEYFAVIRDKKSGTWYIAFRETVDALFARNLDPNKFPEWLMKTSEKLAERRIFIYQAYRHPKDVPILRSQEDWLLPILDVTTFDTIVAFLGKNGVISPEQLLKYK